MFCFWVNRLDILKKMSRKNNLPASFKFALTGFKTAIKNEPNLKIHLLIAFATLITAAILGFTTIEWLILAFTITLVILLELLNTTLEAIVDLVSPKISEKAKVAKDVSAAAVFLAALLATVVGLILFLPKISKIF